MESKSKNIGFKEIRKGLAVYKNNHSKFWFLRMWDPLTKKYVRRSTKETARIEAIASTIEFADNYKSAGHPKHAPKKDTSFEFYANKLLVMSEASGKASGPKKILNRPVDGLLAYFGKYDVAKITRNDMRDFLTFLNGRRETALALSTQKKQCFVIRSVLNVALDDGVINVLPPMPKIGTENKPRASFTDREYLSFMRTLRKSMARGDVVNGAAVTHEWENIYKFIVHIFRVIENPN